MRTFPTSESPRPVTGRPTSVQMPAVKVHVPGTENLMDQCVVGREPRRVPPIDEPFHDGLVQKRTNDRVGFGQCGRTKRPTFLNDLLVDWEDNVVETPRNLAGRAIQSCVGIEASHIQFHKIIGREIAKQALATDSGSVVAARSLLFHPKPTSDRPPSVPNSESNVSAEPERPCSDARHLNRPYPDTNPMQVRNQVVRMPQVLSISILPLFPVLWRWN